MESVYQTLAKIGYTHPLHPTLTHLVMGLVMGAFIFVLIAMFFRRESLARTAWRCMVLALIALLPTAVLGYADWQHRFAGDLIFPITMKLILAGLLLVLLVVAIVMGFRTENWSKNVVTIYAVCLVVVIGIGYFGGELVYGIGLPQLRRKRVLSVKGPWSLIRVVLLVITLTKLITRSALACRGFFSWRSCRSVAVP